MPWSLISIRRKWMYAAIRMEITVWLPLYLIAFSKRLIKASQTHFTSWGIRKPGGSSPSSSSMEICFSSAFKYTRLMADIRVSSISAGYFLICIMPVSIREIFTRAPAIASKPSNCLLHCSRNSSCSLGLKSSCAKISKQAFRPATGVFS